MNTVNRSARRAPVSPLAALIILLLTSSRLPAGGLIDTVTESGHASWQAVGDTPQGHLYHRAVAGSSLPEAMIVTRFDATPARVHALVTDYERFAEFIPNVVESRVLLQTGGTQWVFHHLHFAGPVADRVYVIESSDAASRPQAHYFRVDWSLSDRDFPGTKGSAGVRPRFILRLLGVTPARGRVGHRSALRRSQRSRRIHPGLVGGEDDRPVYSAGDSGGARTPSGNRVNRRCDHGGNAS